MSTLPGRTPEAAPPSLYAQDAPPLAEGVLSEEEVAAEFAAIDRAADSPFFKAYIERDFYRFLATHRRLPRGDDEKPLYRYCGWMLWFVWCANFYLPEVPDRWGYLMEVVTLGRLPDAPIPRIDFTDHWQEKQRVLGDVRRRLERLGHKHGYGERSIEVLADWLAFALGVEKTFPDYLSDETQRWLYQNVNLDDWFYYPRDYLGEVLMEWRGRHKKYTGFYLTPHHICEFQTLATRLMFGGADTRASAASDPACGTARQLLHWSNHSLRLFGNDIDNVCVKIARINCALWAPWALFPPPEYVFADAPALATPVITAGGRLNDSLSVVAPFFIDDAAAHADGQAGDNHYAPDATPPPAEVASPGDDTHEPPASAKVKTRTPRRKHAVSDTNQGCLFSFSLIEADPETPSS